MPVGEHVSPDGQLKFIVICPDGDLTMGFDGFPWHTHGSIVAALSGDDEISATERYVADLVGSHSVIALRRTAGVLKDVWITDDPAGAVEDCKRYGTSDETVEFRLWDGTAVLP
jgi:hypothetical protein